MTTISTDTGPVVLEGDGQDIGLQLHQQVIRPAIEDLLKAGQEETAVAFYTAVVVSILIEAHRIFGHGIAEHIAVAGLSAMCDANAPAAATGRAH